MPTALDLLPFIPLGLLAGLLSGLLGIGGGLVFSPLLLLLGLPPHQALATSTLAIVPTTLAGVWTHWRHGAMPRRDALPIALGAGLGAALCSRWGFGLGGAVLLGMQAGLYGLLALLIRPRVAPGSTEKGTVGAEPPRWKAPLAGVGLVAGLTSGLLGVGGGLVMVPLMVQGLRLPVHLAVRLSTVAVLASAATASVTFLGDGRGLWGVGLALGGTAALAARWSAARLNRVNEARLVALLRLLTTVLACDSARRAIALAGVPWT